MKRGTTKQKRNTITFQPEPDVLTLIRKATAQVEKSVTFKHGVQTRVINNAIRDGLLAIQRDKAA